MSCLKLYTKGRVQLYQVMACFATWAALSLIPAVSCFRYTAGSGNVQYDTSKLKGRHDLSCFYDATGAQLGHRLGQQPVSGLELSGSVYSFEFKREDVFNIGSGEAWWKMVWNSRGTNVLNDFSVWEVRGERIPDGFVCLSPFFYRVDPRGLGIIYNAPSDSDVHGMVAVSTSLVNFVHASKLLRVWDDSDSGSFKHVSAYTGPDSLGLFAFPSYNPDLSTLFVPVLDLSHGTPLQPLAARRASPQ